MLAQVHLWAPSGVIHMDLLGAEASPVLPVAVDYVAAGVRPPPVLGGPGSFVWMSFLDIFGGKSGREVGLGLPFWPAGRGKTVGGEAPFLGGGEEMRLTMGKMRGGDCS